MMISVKEFGAGIGSIEFWVESFGGCVSAGGDGCGVVLLSSLVVGCDGEGVGDGKPVLNNLLRCLGVSQGNGSLMSIGSVGRYVGRSTWSVGDSSLVSIGVWGGGGTVSVGDSLLVSMWELIRPCSWRLLLRLH